MRVSVGIIIHINSAGIIRRKKTKFHYFMIRINELAIHLTETAITPLHYFSVTYFKFFPFLPIH
ncbi:hypothetical protein A9993_10975 [Rahnella victoriana]|nr:hypothetical protein A9993_10975 [Rahnella victoriana]